MSAVGPIATILRLSSNWSLSADCVAKVVLHWRSKNSNGRRCGFRVEMRGTSSPRVKLTCDSVTRLRLYETAITSRFVFSRKNRGPATFDFCNTIGGIAIGAALHLGVSIRLEGADTCSKKLIIELAKPSGLIVEKKRKECISAAHCNARNRVQ